MKNIILFDVNQQHFDLLPLAFTRPVSDIRIGILTIREKWEHRLPGMYSYLTPEYMAAKYPAALSDDNIFIASHILPDDLGKTNIRFGTRRNHRLQSRTACISRK